MSMGLFFLTVSASIGQHQVNFTSRILFLVLIGSAVFLALDGHWGYGSYYPR